jgi:hypothetical protein
MRSATSCDILDKVNVPAIQYPKKARVRHVATFTSRFKGYTRVET